MTDYNNPELYTKIEQDNGDVLFQQVKKKEPQFLQEWDASKVEFILSGDGYITPGNSQTYIKRGRGFRTREDAKTFRDAEQLRMKMRRAAAESWGDEVIDWGDGEQKKNFIKIQNNRLRIDWWAVVDYAIPAFKTRESAQAFIDSVGEEELVKAWRW